MLKDLNSDLYSLTDTSSRKRIIRGIEKALYYKKKNNTGSSENIIRDSDTSETDIKPLVLLTRWKRAELVARIEKRLDQRFEEGMAEEVESLLDEGISPERMDFLGLEYRYITRYLLGEMNFDRMREKLFTEIRRFSKRQATYL